LINTGVQVFLRTCQVNARRWKLAGSVTQHLNENVSDGDGDGKKLGLGKPRAK